MKFLTKITLYLLVFNSISTYAQDYQVRQKKLEAQKITLKKEINQINLLIKDSKKKSSNLVNDLEDLQLKISVRDRLINVNNSQLNNLTGFIENQSNKLSDLKINLLNLKSEYEKIIFSSYKNRSSEMKLLFLFSSENFNQAINRFQYFKQYSKYRKKQADKIINVQEKIEKTIDSLEIIKKEKERIINENSIIKSDLNKEKYQQNQLLKNLLKNQKNYLSEINKKEKQAREIDDEIKKLIRLAINESNKNNNSNNFELTPEGRIISNNFRSNKGRLPWPVREGVIIRRYGTQAHPVVRTATIKSNGISIATSPNSIAYSVFNGEVLSVYGFSGGNPGVLVRHGKYISNYQNLSSIFVKKGDIINANEELGVIFTNESTGKTILKFNIFNELTPENPAIWLDK
tara:strand:- start:2993 stop:4201 length:1209 start_codon:yes stop_codon:yes gene_type:complete